MQGGSEVDIVEATGDMLDPAAAAWTTVPVETVRLAPVPLEGQPNAYIRAAWAGRPYGRVSEVRVATVRSGDSLLVRLEWERSGDPPGEFADAAAVFFPAAGGTAPPITIGTHAEPVTLWAWRDRLEVQAALPQAKELIATGPGTFRPRGASAGDTAGTGQASERPGSVAAASRCEQGRWNVVVQGDLGPASKSGRMGIVVWDGSNDERAGIGAVSPDWLALSSS